MTRSRRQGTGALGKWGNGSNAPQPQLPSAHSLGGKECNDKLQTASGISLAAMLLIPWILSGCGYCITGGGMTKGADAFPGIEKETEIGVGGPGWWLFKRLGIRFVREEDLAATLAMKGIHGIQVSQYVLEDPGDAVRQQVLDFYTGPLRRKGWEQLAGMNDDAERIAVYAELGEQHFRGIFVVAFEGNQLNVVKLTGDLKPEMFGELNRRLPVLGQSLPEE